jgi:outer membrane protein assembly factor BamB
VFYPSPIVKDNVVYFITDTSSAIPLPAKVAETMKPSDFPERWSATLAQGFFASPVIHDGLIYAVSNSAEYLVLDAAKGDIVLRKPLKLLDTGKKPKPQMYPSVSVAGKHVFVSNDAGDTVILALGREFKEVARIRFGDGSAATPIFDGAYFFLRGEKTLYCVGK